MWAVRIQLVELLRRRPILEAELLVPSPQAEALALHGEPKRCDLRFIGFGQILSLSMRGPSASTRASTHSGHNPAIGHHAPRQAGLIGGDGRTRASIGGSSARMRVGHDDCLLSAAAAGPHEVDKGKKDDNGHDDRYSAEGDARDCHPPALLHSLLSPCLSSELVQTNESDGYRYESCERDNGGQESSGSGDSDGQDSTGSEYECSDRHAVVVRTLGNDLRRGGRRCHAAGPGATALRTRWCFRGHFSSAIEANHECHARIIPSRRGRTIQHGVSLLLDSR